MKKASESYHGFQYPWRDGNRFEILIDGPSFIPAMLEAIEAAERHILLEMYLIESGDLARRFIKAIQQAAERKVQVFILLDDYGSIGLESSDLAGLDRKNIHLAYYNKLRSHSTLYNLYRIFLHRQAHGLYRNHRKLLLVDNRIAFVGGIGLTDEFDPPRQSELRWRETMIKIEGPVIVDWSHLFGKTWMQSLNKPLELEPGQAVKYSEGQQGRVTISDPRAKREVLQSLIKQIRQARQKVWIATAYFVPTWRIRRALKRAALSGADVRLLLPGHITDHPGVRYASQRFYSRLLKNGVRIFEYQPRFYHAKCVVCDNWVSIGSANFDRWNFRWNLEANQEVKDQLLARQVKEMFIEDFSHSVELTYEQWQRRSWILRLTQWFWKQVERFSQRIGRE